TPSAARQPHPTRRNAFTQRHRSDDPPPKEQSRRPRHHDQDTTSPMPSTEVPRQRQCRFLLFTMSHNGRRRPAPPQKSSSSDQIGRHAPCPPGLARSRSLLEPREMVEANGFEPMTSGLQSRRSPS